MIRLLLMRHAKSDWPPQAMADHARPLNRRGRLAAPLMAAWIADSGYALDAVRLSDSARTRETWDRMRPLLPDPPLGADATRTLYHAEPDALLAEARSLPEDAATGLIIAHNPGLDAAAARLATPDGTARAISFPTAAIAVFEADGPWRMLQFGAMRLIAFEQPKSLV